MPTTLTMRVLSKPDQQGPRVGVVGVYGMTDSEGVKPARRSSQLERGGDASRLGVGDEVVQQAAADEQDDREEDELADDGEHTHIPIERDGCAGAASASAAGRAARLVSHGYLLLGFATRIDPGSNRSAVPGVVPEAR